jgi:NAD(P)-dependent dehydrogenase (short-subunit alcohol dehydrogenase family)
MEPKIALITGATEGVGKATAVGLAQRGYRVLLHGRNPEKARAAQAEVIATSGNAAVDVVLADFASLDAVRQLAGEVSQTYPRLDVLVNNAAGMFAERQTSADGLEMNLAVNHLAPFLLTHLLLDSLKAAPAARIVNVSSSGYKQAKPDFTDLQAERGYAMQSVYFNSKLFTLYFTLDLAERLRGTGITVNAVHPGVVRTQLARDFRGPMKWLFAVMMPLFFISPEKGAETSVFAATAPELDGVTGRYFTKKKEEAIRPIGLDAVNRRELWERSEKLVGLA